MIIYVCVTRVIRFKMTMKCIIFVCLFVITFVNAENKQCSTGDQKVIECNRCNCNNGSWSCAKNDCSLSKHSTQKRSTTLPQLPSDGSCVPGNTYQNGDATCRCIASSPPRCVTRRSSSKRSADKFESTNKNTNGITYPPLPADGSCILGKSYKDGCNICSCFGEKALLCKRQEDCIENREGHILSDAGGQIGEQQICEEGDTKQGPLEDCNSCVCSKGKHGFNEWSCSTNKCFNDRPKRGAGTIADLKNTPCAPNDSFRLDCNTCYCNSAKTGYRCTEHICVPDNSTEILIAQNATDAIPFNVSHIFNETSSIFNSSVVSESSTPVAQMNVTEPTENHKPEEVPNPTTVLQSTTPSISTTISTIAANCSTENSTLALG